MEKIRTHSGLGMTIDGIARGRGMLSSWSFQVLRRRVRYHRAAMLSFPESLLGLTRGSFRRCVTDHWNYAGARDESGFS